MSTGPYPHNLSVIKAITKVIEAHNATVLHQFLPVLIPGLIQVRVLLRRFLKIRHEFHVEQEKIKLK